jgi:hypothetical protein
MSRCGLIHKRNNLKTYSILGLLVGVCLAVGSLSCGGGSPGSSGSVAIAFATGTLAPPSSLALSGTSSFAAIVTGDPSALGVNWTVTCVPAPIPQGSCGTITEHTASGYPTTYFAPFNYDEQTVPVNGTVTITGASSANPSQTVSATIQVTPTPPISVGFNEAPPASMLTGATANLVAVVLNDSSNAGADFTLTCGGTNSCGTIVPAHTSGIVGAFTVYTAPDIVPADGTVTITAASTADPTQTVSATVTIKQASLKITLSQTPTPNLPVGASTNLTAVVTFDPANAGVDWSVSCQSTLCGSFNPAHTASGQLTTYTAPLTVPTNGLVTITAASTTAPTTTVTAQVTITPANLRNDLLNGRYAFLLQGVREGGPWAIAGSLFADGVGDINVVTEQFLGDNNTYSVSGTYFIGSDGVGTITLNGAPTGLGYWFNGQQIFQVSAASSGLMSMEEFDGYYDPTLHVAYGGTLSGTLQRQSAAGFQPLSPSDSYCFLLSGVGQQDAPAFYGGVLSGSTLIFDMDRSIGGVIDSISGQTSFNSVSSDGSSGNIVMGPYSFGYFVVDSSHWIIIAGAGSTDLPAGQLYLQHSLPLSPHILAFTETGATPLPQGSSPLALGGLLNLDAQGNMVGLMDANINGTVTSAQISGNLSMSSSGPTQGRGILTVTGGAAQQFAFYPTAYNGALLLELDPQMSGVGVALPQTSGSVATASLFSGTYAAAYQTTGEINAVSGGVGSWNDFLGLITANGVSSLAGTMALDQFDESSGAFWTQTPNAPLSGSFSVGEGGRFPGSFTVPPLATSQQIFYILDSSTVLSLGLDSGPSTGILQLQQLF